MPERRRNKAKTRKRAFLVFLLIVAMLGLVDLVLPSEATYRHLVKPLIGMYRVSAGLVRDHDCPSHPSCSSYALEAYKKHGLIMGTFLTVDRLIGEPGRMKEGPWVRTEDGKRVHDPLEANTFWWSE